jgi:repressor LexA
LQRRWEREGALPSPSQLAQELGLHYTTLRQHLQALAKKGYLRFEGQGVGRAPLVRLLGQGGVPLLGDIPAGPLSEAIEAPEGRLKLPGASSLYGLQVSGNSMADLIQDGDVVLLDKNARPHPGNICAVRLEGEVTLKYLEWIEGARTLKLRPHNPQYPTVEAAARALEVVGVYRGLLRGEVIQALLTDD